MSGPPGGGLGLGLGRAGAGGGGGGGPRRGGGGPPQLEKLREELGLSSHQPTWSEYLVLLKPYFAPAGWENRASVLACYFFLGAGKVLSLGAPVFLERAVNALARGVVPVADVVAFSLLRFLVSVCEEAQRLVYLRVKEAAYLETASQVFSHLHSLSLSWHVSKRAGAVLRAADRGINSASSIVDMLVLRLAPTVVEVVVLIALFFFYYGSPAAAGVLALTFVAYFVVTYVLTQWRTRARSAANVADNDATQVWADSLTGFEVVKAFTTEAFELARYRRAIALYQAAARSSQTSLVVLNMAQSFLIRAASGGVMIAIAVDVVAGRTDVGAFVAMLTWVAQLFAPLGWLGMMYGAVMAAVVDMSNLASLLAERPGVQDAPDALPLLLDDAAGGGGGGGGGGARGLEVEFRGVSFSYPAAADKLEAATDRARAAAAADAAAADARAGAARRLAATAAGALGGGRRYEELSSPGEGGRAGGRGRGGGGGGGPAVADADAAAEWGTHDAVAISVVGAPATALSPPRGARAASALSPPPPPPAPGGAARPVLHDVSFRIPAGKTVAVVGATGSGKSTLGRLLARYYDVDGGAVLVGGTDVRALQQLSLRAAVGFVSQDSVLFNASIGYNIAYGAAAGCEGAALRVPREAVEAAARQARIHDFIVSLPQGYETKVGERGLKLSGGEKQRVAIARVLIKNPPLLVLDEATSALDSITEAAVQSALNAARAGRSALVIAHRLSTIRDADEILVLDAGTVAEAGTHDELLARGGKYAALWAQQAKMSIAAAGANDAANAAAASTGAAGAAGVAGAAGAVGAVETATRRGARAP